MRSLKTTLIVSWIVMAGLIGIVVGQNAIGSGSNSSLAQSVVTIDLGAALEKLDQQADARRRIAALRAQRDAQQEQWVTHLEGLQGTYKAAIDRNASEDEIRAMQNEFNHYQIRYQSWRAFVSERIDHEASLLLRDVYRAIQEELGVMCVSSGYELVVRDDSVTEIPVDRSAQVAQEIQVMQAMTSVFVLHATPLNDVTDALVVRMNNNWANTERDALPAPTLDVPDMLKLPASP